MDEKNRRVISLVVLGVLVLQIIIVTIKYVQYCYDLNNPLIPRALLIPIRNYTIAVVGIYILPIIVNGIFLIKKRFFWAAMVISFLCLIAVVLFGHKLQQYFFQIL